MIQRKEIRIFSEGFKKQVVSLYNMRKSRSKILREYDLSATAFDRWVKRNNKIGSFKEKENCSIEQEELLRLQK